MSKPGSVLEVTFVPDSAAEIKCEVISPREVLLRHDRGIDWSADRIVIARTKDESKQLWWRKSGKHWADILTGYTTDPAELVLTDDCPPFSHVYPYCRSLQEGGRLSNKLLRAKAKEIDEFFGCSITQFLDITTTTVIVMVDNCPVQDPPKEKL